MLFEILKGSIEDIELPIISDNYTVLYFDEFPMLFTGTNLDGDRIVGSLICEDEEKDIFRFLHLRVNNRDYLEFIRRRISYRQLIERQQKVFILDKDESDNIVNTYWVSTSIIPTSFLPHSDLMCPNAELVIGSEFTVSMKGKIGDIHEALVEPVRNISKNVYQALKSIFEGIKMPNVLSDLHQVAYTPTSFGINFKIKFTSNDMYFNAKAESALNELVSTALNYSLNNLASEAENLAKNQIEGTQYKKTVLAAFDKAHDLLHHQADDKARDKLLTCIKKVPFELEKMAEELGKGFEYLEIKSHNITDNTSQSIGIIDYNFTEQISKAAGIIESEGSKVHEDDEYTEYEIHVYHLNIETRNGNAHIKNTNDRGKEIQDNPKLSFVGNGILAGSTFIDSMDTGEWIKVMAKAKKVNGRYKLLKIDFD